MNNEILTANPIKVMPKQFTSFEEIVKVGGLNNGYYPHLQSNQQCKNAILSPVTVGEEELYLYWEGDGQVVPGGKDIYAYFAEQGYEVVEKAHPSLLINAMTEFTEEKLAELGIPGYVDIVLPTTEDSLLPNEIDYLCFLEVDRNDGSRKLNMANFVGKWYNSYAFLLRRIKPSKA